MFLKINEHNLFSLCNVTCMYVFRTDQLALDNQTTCSYLGKSISPTRSFPQVPGVLCVELRLPGPSFIYFHMSVVVVLFSSYLGSYVGETLWM